MPGNRYMHLTVGGLVLVVTLSVWLVIWPNYRAAAAVQRRVDELQLKIKTLGQQMLELEQLAATAASERQRVADEFKVIPQNADLAALIRKLSLPIDGTRVLDQTFTAGSAGEAIIGGNSTPQSMPLTVDMVATFDSVFALIRAAETMNRLVRITTVRITCKREEQKTDTPILQASIGMEAIYEPTSSGEWGVQESH